ESPLKRLFEYSKLYSMKIYTATLFSVLNKLFDLAPPILIGAAVDIVVRRENSIFSNFGISNLIDQLIFLAILTLIIWLSESLFEYLYKIQWRNLAQIIEHKLRMDAYDHIQRLDMEWFEDQKSGGLMSILNDDVNQLERFLDNSANALIQVTVTVIFITLSFFGANLIIGGISLIPIPIIIYFSFKFQKSLEPRYKEVRNTVGLLNSHLSNNLSGITTIKSYTNEKFESERVSKSSMDYQLANSDAIKFSSAFSPLIRIIIVTGFIGMLIVGGIFTINGEMEIAVYSVVIFLIQRLLWPLTSLGETFDQYQRAMASTTRILNLLDTQPLILDGEVNLEEEVKGEIIFDDVNFDYPSRNNILRKLSFKIEGGKTIAFVGSTGAGKSTIIKLLLRLYDPQSGTISLDGHNIKDLKLNELRSSIGIVPQETFILDGTIRENILYGNHKATEKDIFEASKIAELDQFILSLDDKYETLVGERGQKLSGGQKQRLSIARAVLKNPPVLILDEATSSVDNETEAAIQRSLEKIIKGRSTILIAHRLSTIVNADKIYVLESGKINGEGTHSELLVNNETYAKLWNVQTGQKMELKK
ncbi:ABC transporter ATP-binding protein, partial [archaeon]|nr:ABC transporter ATP-binding protein [archaeon]NDB79647.1 ABC transporter ATP-binding protein [archaeon]